VMPDGAVKLRTVLQVMPDDAVWSHNILHLHNEGTIFTERLRAFTH